MKTCFEVHNHQPVPLRPLDELLRELVRQKTHEAVLYLDELLWANQPLQSGWYIWSSSHFTACDGSNDFWGDELDYRLARARLLQPGERLVITFEGA